MDETTFPEPLAIAIQKDIIKVLKEIGEMKQGMNEMKQGMNEMKQGMNEMKQGMNEMKQGMGQMKQEIGEIKQTMATKEDLRNYATLSDVRNIVSDAKNEILKEVDHLRIRTSRLEEKVGIAPAHG